jgi:hypothetical protein
MELGMGLRACLPIVAIALLLGRLSAQPLTASRVNFTEQQSRKVCTHDH